jgi:hypothetical protein
MLFQFISRLRLSLRPHQTREVGKRDATARTASFAPTQLQNTWLIFI